MNYTQIYEHELFDKYNVNGVYVLVWVWVWVWVSGCQVCVPTCVCIYMCVLMVSVLVVEAIPESSSSIVSFGISSEIHFVSYVLFLVH